MSRLEDIKELSFGITPVSDFVISRARGSAGEDFSVTLPSVDIGHPPGADITIRGLNGFVTTREYVSGPDGYRTVIIGVSKVADIIRKAPAKTLMFMSMTPSELEEFQIANMVTVGDNQVVDYSSLDYIPLIRVCDDRTLTGAWTSDEVIRHLVERMGLQLICNVRSYWVRQVQADVQSSYFDTIVSLINFLKPTVYIDEGVLYILNKPYRGGSVSFDKISQASQREVYNYNSKVTYVRVQGGLGPWDRSKYKGKVEEERESTIENTAGSETGQQMYFRLGGDLGSVDKMLGIRADQPEVSMNVDMSGQAMSDETTTTETYRLDPFGSNKALLSRHTVTKNRVLGDPPVKTFESTETYEYEFLDEQFDKPRVVKKESSVGRYTWELVTIPGIETYRHFKQKVDNVIERYVYAPNGNLLAEIMTRMADCFKVGTMLIEVDLGDYYWTPEGGNPYSGNYEQQIVQERIVRYRQVTQDTYQRMTYERKLGGVRRKPGDGQHSTAAEFIKGRVPKYPRSYRRMAVYAEEVPAGESMEVPALVVSNPNIVSWDDAAAVLAEIKRNVINYQYSIERELIIPKDIPVDIGWPVEFGTLPAGMSGAIPAVSVRDAMIASWSKRKDAASGTVITTLVLEGKVE
jgi:hypothetical protein